MFFSLSLIAANRIIQELLQVRNVKTNSHDAWTCQEIHASTESQRKGPDPPIPGLLGYPLLGVDDTNRRNGGQVFDVKFPPMEL